MKQINVKGIRVYGFHGCMEEEALMGTWFETDVSVNFDYTASAETDDLSKTTDYVRIREIAEEEMKTRQKLIETVIKRIADRIRGEFAELSGFRIELKKFNPPINGEVNYVSVVWEE